MVSNSSAQSTSKYFQPGRAFSDQSGRLIRARPFGAFDSTNPKKLVKPEHPEWNAPMRKLTFGMNMSLDGYIAAPGDDLNWSIPSDELFQWWSDRVGATGLRCTGANCGRR